jgi:hypothetical protein
LQVVSVSSRPSRRLDAASGLIRDRSDKQISQCYFVDESLKALGTLFGGATAYPQGKVVWRDDAQGGKLLVDEPVVIQCYASEQAVVSQFELTHYSPETSAMKPATKRWISAGGRL